VKAYQFPGRLKTSKRIYITLSLLESDRFIHLLDSTKYVTIAKMHALQSKLVPCEFRHLKKNVLENI